MNTFCIHKRHIWRFDEEGNAGLALGHTWHFTAPVSLSGFVLPRCWDMSGNPRFIRALRLLALAPGSEEWREVWQSDDLPAHAPTTVQFPAVTAVAARLEATRIHPPTRTPKTGTVREDCLDAHELLGGALPHEGFQWLSDAQPEPSPCYFDPPQLALDVAEKALPGGVSVERAGESVVMDNGWLRIGCSLESPRLTHLGWDQLETGRQRVNLLNLNARANPRNWPPGNAPFSNGPFITPLRPPKPASSTDGRIRVSGSRVAWEKVPLFEGVELDAAFTLDADGLDWELTLRVAREMVVADAEAWRLAWDLQTCMVSPLAMVHKPFSNGRAGRCEFPLILHAPNHGNVRLDAETGEPRRLFLITDVDSKNNRGLCGIELGCEPLENGDARLLPGVHTARFRLRRCEVAPDGAANVPAIRRAWAGGFPFAPANAGMACMAFGGTAWFQTHQFADHARATGGESGEFVRALTRYSVELGLRNGPGYGSLPPWGFADSDPSMAIASCVMAEGAPAGWTEALWPRMRECGQRIRASLLDGVATNTAYTGNSGERAWSTNWWDTICFGYRDAYANALAWRGLNLLAGVAGRLGETADAASFADAAAQLKRAYWPCFCNPETGLAAGWRSADGKLHDHSFLFVNGISIVYGLTPPGAIAGVAQRLEDERRRMGYARARLGFPGNVRPIPVEDIARGEERRSRFGYFQNGGVSACMSHHWMGALGIAGVPGLREIEDDLLLGFEQGFFGGARNAHSEFRCRDGTPSGDVGILADQFNVLLAILQNRGLAKPLLLG